MTTSLNDKPLGGSLGWHLHGTTWPYQSRWHNLRRDEVRLPDGEEIVYTYQEHPGFVTIVPQTRHGHVVLIRSYRYTVDDWCWELPAGGLGDKPGLSKEAVARQELLEETGGVCTTMDEIGWFYVANGTTNSRCTVFLTRNVELTQPTALESTEVSEVHLVPVAEALQMARDGRMTDGDSALALLRCEAHLLAPPRRVELVPYDLHWPLMFAAEAARLRVAFGDELIALHHIGSTAVPGLAAKPIIDMLPVVRDIARVDALNTLMRALGYVPKGEYGIPGRRYFSLDAGGQRRFHLHVFAADSTEIARHCDFVAWLRAHPATAAAYAALKLELAERYRNDPVSYTESKSDFIRNAVQQAQTR
ncbi:MAG: GrpB family protein [Caldilineales bacterium]|mgnify:CR=1 FL=1